MASYKIEWKPSALKELRTLPKEAIGRILDAVEALKDNPFPQGSRNSRWTVILPSPHRSYRVIYIVAAEVLLVEINKVGHRKNVYK